MKKLGLYLAVLVFTIGLSTGVAAQTQPLQGTCIVLVHGILGFDDTQGLLNGLVKYWGGLDGYLRSKGAKVATPASPAMANLETRARETIQYLEGTSTNPGWRITNGCSKVHLVGHSQGGLVSRYMVKYLNYASKVATVTSVNTPHQGSPVADVVLNVIPDWLEPFVGLVLDNLAKLIYRDGRPQDAIAMGGSLTVSYLSNFNKVATNVPTVKYYSYGSKMAWADPIQHPVMALLYPATWAGGIWYGMGSSNDGIVPFSSQKWGTWKGEPSTYWYATGVDHLQATNLEWSGQSYYDVQGYYLNIALNAKAGL
jgi:triacylglycerol lipase